MRRCPNCSQLFRDDRKICRNCGAILVATDDQPVTASALPPEPAEPDADSLEDECRAVATESPSADHHLPTDQPNQDLSDKEIDPSIEPGNWECPQCHVGVPRSFDVCWNCQTVRPQDELSAKQPEPVMTTSLDPPVAPPVQAEPIEAQLVDEHKSPLSACPQCGSTKIMRGVIIRDQGEGSSGELQVVVARNPSALVFKDRRYSKIRADICGRCGHVQLRVSDPASLYAHYRASRRGR
jgi:predicted RNA-binding Zn-ribbon protein involved in translation (DUF1610 family)